MMYLYCPKCGNKYAKTDQINSFTCTKCEFIFYNNPKPVVVAFIKNEQGNILMTKRAMAPYQGYWSLPGGFMRYGEEPQDALERELREELGVDATIGDILTAYHEFYENEGRPEEKYSIIVSIFSATLPSNSKLTPTDDVSEYAFFPPNKLPKNIAFTGLKKFLQNGIAIIS